MLSAPSSFKKFMQATKRAKEQMERRDRQRRIAQGFDVSDDDAEETASAQREQEKHDVAPTEIAVEGNESGSDEDEGPSQGWLRPDKGDGLNGPEDENVNGDRTGGRKDKKDIKRREGEETSYKRKYMSLRERKREARKMAKLAKEEGEMFMNGQLSETQAKQRAGEPSFGEVADAPPTITLKRKGGGKGAKSVPVAESGHKIAGGKGAGNRQAQIFKHLIQTAQVKNAPKSSTGTSPSGHADGVGLRQVAEMKALREQVITGYRRLKGRPMNNGRSASLAADPSQLFTATGLVGAATIRRDAGR